MWIFTRYGFFSIACAEKQGGGTDEDKVMVRARMREHLNSLRERFPDTSLSTAPILTHAGTDYMFRIIVPKTEWAAILSELAMELNWRNSKSEAAKFAREKGTSHHYIEALHDVWSIMAELQDR
jgi:hypothetical protein